MTRGTEAVKGKRTNTLNKQALRYTQLLPPPNQPHQVNVVEIVINGLT